MPNTEPQLQLGDVTFYNLEIPEELPHLFGVQKVAVHDFPSNGAGNRTVQTLGSFPFPDIEWHGTFFKGDAPQDPIDRASILNTYKVSGKTKKLTWGPFQFDVLVEEFEIVGKLRAKLDYRIKVIPLFDHTTTSNTASSTIPPATALNNANQAVQDSTKSPTTGAIFGADVVEQSSLITNNTNQAVTSAGGNITNIPQSTISSIQSQISDLQDTLLPMINGNDFATASASSVLYSNLAALSTTLGIEQAGVLAAITVTNPNLVVLASQYYGDASLWPLIAQANFLQTQNPIGTFTLVIPQSSTQSQFIPTN